MNRIEAVPGQYHVIEEAKRASSLTIWRDAPLSLPKGGTWYGYLLSGRGQLSAPWGEFPLVEGMYFALPDTGEVQGGHGILFHAQGYHGFFHLGGPVEERGRLQYLNGCTDSLLISPVVKGDPCLNLLHIPAGVDQTAHDHPSVRFGVVTYGSGICRTPTGSIPLIKGACWCIPANSIHSFHTRDSAMTVIAYHPDSDFGPDHESHPMLNRTIVNGMSASDLRKQDKEQRHEMP